MIDEDLVLTKALFAEAIENGLSDTIVIIAYIMNHSNGHLNPRLVTEFVETKMKERNG